MSGNNNLEWLVEERAIEEEGAMILLLAAGEGGGEW
jgi:hypothetical protein